MKYTIYNRSYNGRVVCDSFDRFCLDSFALIRGRGHKTYRKINTLNTSNCKAVISRISRASYDLVAIHIEIINPQITEEISLKSQNYVPKVDSLAAILEILISRKISVKRQYNIYNAFTIFGNKI